MRTLLLCTLTAAVASCWAQAHPPVRTVGGGQQEPKTTRQPEDSSARARRLLQASMARTPVANIRVIFNQRIYYNSSIFQQVKVEMSKDGKIHHIVIAPLSQQGLEDVDDGRTLRTYIPDEKCVIEQPSGLQEGDGVGFRMGLVRKNYTLRIDHKEKIAGRDATVVQAIPNDDELEMRCYSIDDKTGFLLRFETCRDGRPPMLHLEAKVVEFPAEFSENTFRLDAPFVKTEHFRRKGVAPGAAYKLADELGFQPVVPANLPYGFEAQGLQASTDSRSPALIVRMTDGLAKVTVYEWRKMPGSRGSDSPLGTLSGSSATLTVLVSGDVPDGVKARILRSFVNGGRQQAANIPSAALSRDLELGCGTEVLPLDRESGDTASMIKAMSWLNRN